MEQLRSNHQKLALCAKLSKFAYTSANPGASISIDDEKAKAVLRKNVLGLAHDSQADHFERFASKSWWHQNFETQKRWFRSQSFFYRYDDPTAKVSKIIVAFRGTWNDPSAEREWKQVTKGTCCTPS